MMTLQLLTVVLASMAQSPATAPAVTDRVPKMLVDAFRHRMDYKTGRFQLRIESDWPGYNKTVRNIETRWADEVVLFEDSGNDEGIRMTEPHSGEALFGVRYSCSPESRVLDRKKGTMWTHAEACAFFAERPSRDWVDYVDIRTYGLRALEIQKKDPLELLDMLTGSFRQREIGEGVRCINYTGKPSNNGDNFEIEWDIDGSNGPAVLAVREYLYARGEKRRLMAEARNDLALVDGIWWPAHTRISIITSGITHDVTFTRIEFNRKDHDQVISVDSLGMPAGVMVGRIGSSQPQYYMGRGISIDQERWIQTRASIDIGPLRQFMAKTSELGDGDYPAWWSKGDLFGLKDVEIKPDLWETYVRRWALKHTNNGSWRVQSPLTDEQRTAAQGILDDCRKQATPIRSRIDKEAARLKAELTEVSNRLAKADDKSRAELTKRAGELMAQSGKFKQAPEIERIFDSLKKRLDGLLTKEQLAPYVPAKPVPPPPGPRPAPKRPGAAVP